MNDIRDILDFMLPELNSMYGTSQRKKTKSGGVVSQSTESWGKTRMSHASMNKEYGC